MHLEGDMHFSVAGLGVNAFWNTQDGDLVGLGVLSWVWVRKEGDGRVREDSVKRVRAYSGIVSTDAVRS